MGSVMRNMCQKPNSQAALIPTLLAMFGGGEGLCVVVNENLRANLRAFFLVMASESIFFFLGATSSWAFIHCASLARNEQYSCTCTYLSKTIFCYCKSNVQEIISSIYYLPSNEKLVRTFGLII